MKKSQIFQGIWFFLLGIALLFVVFPLIKLWISLSGERLLAALRDQEVWQAIGTSFLAASGATLLGLVLGAPSGYILARYRFRGRSVIESLLDIPIVIPHVAVGIMLLNILNPNTPLGRLAGGLHISFVDTLYGIMVAMCFVSFSYLVSAAHLGFRSLSPELELAARTLGASPWYTFTRITLPLLIPYLLRGALLAFARSLSEMGALLILAYYPKTAPILLYERFENYGLQEVRAITALIVSLSLALFCLLVWSSRKLNSHGT